jgi:acetyltransferase-like isoleucine patch superfamily enzyme
MRRRIRLGVPWPAIPPPGAFRHFGEASWVVPPAFVRAPDRIAIGSRVVVMEHGTLLSLGEGENLAISLGDGVRLARFNTIVCEVGVVLGEGVATSDSVTIRDTWCDVKRPTDALAGIEPPPPAPVTIGRGAYLACNSIILPGVTVGEGAYVGEGAVVADDVPDHTVVYGNPATVVRRYDSAARRWNGRGQP